MDVERCTAPTAVRSVLILVAGTFVRRRKCVTCCCIKIKVPNENQAPVESEIGKNLLSAYTRIKKEQMGNIQQKLRPKPAEKLDAGNKALAPQPNSTAHEIMRVEESVNIDIMSHLSTAARGPSKQSIDTENQAVGLKWSLRQKKSWPIICAITFLLALLINKSNTFYERVEINGDFSIGPATVVSTNDHHTNTKYSPQRILLQCQYGEGSQKPQSTGQTNDSIDKLKSRGDFTDRKTSKNIISRLNNSHWYIALTAWIRKKAKGIGDIMRISKDKITKHFRKRLQK